MDQLINNKREPLREETQEKNNQQFKVKTIIS